MPPPKCPRCDQETTDPRMLNCFHTFCLNCLLKLQPAQDSTSSNGQVELKCYTCGIVTSVDAVEALPPNGFLLIRSEVDLSNHQALHFCYFHKNRFEKYCDTCMKLCCSECISKSHASHTLLDFPEAVKKYQSIYLPKFKKQIQAYTANMENLHNVEKKINDTFGDFIEKLKAREQELIDEAHASFVKANPPALEGQSVEAVRTHLARAHAILKRIHEKCDAESNPNDFYKMAYVQIYKTFRQRVADLAGREDINDDKPLPKPVQMVFSTTPAFKKFLETDVNQFGEIVVE